MAYICASSEQPIKRCETSPWGPVFQGFHTPLVKVLPKLHRASYYDSRYIPQFGAFGSSGSLDMMRHHGPCNSMIAQSCLLVYDNVYLDARVTWEVG